MAITRRTPSAKAAGTGAVTPALPTGMSANDVVFLVASTIAGGTCTISANGSVGTWNVVTGSPINVASGEKLYVWWGVWTSGSTGPTVTPGSDHCCAATQAFGGVDTTSPIGVNAIGTETSSDTSFSFATGITTTHDNSRCCCVATNGADSDTGQVPVMTNANLTGLTLEFNYETAQGGGGGFGFTSGARASAGAMGTFACTMGTASTKAYIAWELTPVAQEATPSPVAATWSVTTPTVTVGGITAEPASVTATWSVPTPTVTVGGITATPSPVAATWSVPEPVITNVLNATPDPIAATWSVPEPVVTVGGIVAEPDPISAAWSVPEPVVSVSGIEATPDPIDVAWTVTTPVVTNVLNATPDPVAATWSVPTPTVTVGGIEATPDPITAMWSIPQAAVRNNRVLWAVRRS